MVRLVIAVASLLALASCHSNCQQLGDRLCACRPAGTTADTCKNAVKNEVQRANPGKSVEAECALALDTCDAPADTDFCDFLAGRCGKALCRISAESYCDDHVCSADVTCDPKRCGMDKVTIAATDHPPICTIETGKGDPVCPKDTVCNKTVCPADNQPAACSTP